jgi:hypothetical protein
MVQNGTIFNHLVQIDGQKIFLFGRSTQQIIFSSPFKQITNCDEF